MEAQQKQHRSAIKQANDEHGGAYPLSKSFVFDETDKAYHYQSMEGGTWLPKSQIIEAGSTMYVPKWLYREAMWEAHGEHK